MNQYLLSLLPVKVEFALLVLTRVLALIGTMPIFSTASPWTGYRIALGVGITWTLLFAVEPPHWTVPQFGLALVPLMAKEFLVGALMGWIVNAAFGSVRGAGDLVTGEMGLNLAAMVDPVSGTTSQAMTTLYQTIAGIIFLGIGAHRWVIAAVARSFVTIPVGTFQLGNDPVGWLLSTASRFIEAGIVLAAPMMAAMFLVTLILGVISRAVPQLNILDVGYGFRVAAGFGGVIALLPALRVGIESLFSTVRDLLPETLNAAVR